MNPPQFEANQEQKQKQAEMSEVKYSARKKESDSKNLDSNPNLDQIAS